MRRAALRAPMDDPSAMLFSYSRSLRILGIATWVVWVTALITLQLEEHLRLFFDRNSSMGPIFAATVFTLVPPALINVVCEALSYPIYSRVQSIEWSQRDQIWQELWHKTSFVLPIIFFASGTGALFDGKPGLAVGWFALGVVSRTVCVHFLLTAVDMSLHALSVGELRDKVFELAKKARVELRQLYLLPTSQAKVADALAVQSDYIILTDYLLLHLSKREVDAVVAHELAHLKLRHPAKLRRAYIFGLGASIGTYIILCIGKVWSVGSWGEPIRFLCFVGLIGLGLLAVLFLSRWFEQKADAGAVDLTGDPEALITALRKLTRLNLTPIQWNHWDEKTLTHPSTARRVESISRRGGMSPERLREVLDGSEGMASRYPIPEELTVRGKVFSTDFKNSMLIRRWCANLITTTLVPALVSKLVRIAQWQGLFLWGAYFAGAVGTIACYYVLINWVLPTLYRNLERRIQIRLKESGVLRSTTGGIFVGFGPGSSPRLYESVYDWDVGYFFLGDRLAYLGEEARFSLSQDQVTNVRLGAGTVGRWHLSAVYIDWRDQALGKAGTFHLRPLGDQPFRRLESEACSLFERIEAWRQGQASGFVLPEPLAELPPPGVDEVTSESPKVIGSSKGFVRQLIFLTAAGTAFSLLFGLPFDPREGGTAFYVLGVAFLSSVFIYLPFWRYRDPDPSSSGFFRW